MNVIYQLAPVAMDVVAIVGAVTLAIFAASMGPGPEDIKKFSPIPPSANSVTCSWLSVWARSQREFFI